MNIQTFVIGAILGAVAGYLIAVSIAPASTPEAATKITMPESAVELTKCMPAMGYHYADPDTLPRGPIYMRDGAGEVVGVEYLLLEEELEVGDGPEHEFMLSAFEAGFTNVSLTYMPDGISDLPVPLYALHLYKIGEDARAGICEGEELEEEAHHGDESSTGLMVGENAIAVFDQPAGETVTVSMATLAENGFIVIHEVEDGAPGPIIASSNLLNAGENSNTEISLPESPVDGTALVAMLHVDNGDGEFNASDDAPVGHDGSPIMMQFMIDADADVPAGVSI